MLKLGVAMVPKALSGVGAITGVASVGKCAVVLSNNKSEIENFNKEKSSEILHFKKIKEMRESIQLTDWHIDHEQVKINAYKIDKKVHQEKLDVFRKKMYEEIQALSKKKLSGCKPEQSKKEVIQLAGDIRFPVFRVIEYRHC